MKCSLVLAGLVREICMYEIVCLLQSDKDSCQVIGGSIGGYYDNKCMYSDGVAQHFLHWQNN